jgi:DNA mismatch endonuclease (patch repair protein)
VADTFTKPERSQIMRAVRARGNKATELVLLNLFRANGIKGWRRHANLPGRPDFIFPKQKIAIFVDGCFWHGCKKHCRMPASNQTYWNKKIARNIERDCAIRKLLKSRGWHVIRVWEHVLRIQPKSALRRIVKVLTKPLPSVRTNV